MKTNSRNIRRSKSLKLLLLVALVIFGTTPSKAQQPVSLNLKDALNYAVKANQNARKARLDVENSQYRIDEVRLESIAADKWLNIAWHIIRSCK